MSAIDRSTLANYLLSIKHANGDRTRDNMKRALKLFLMSNLIDNTDLLDTNVPYDEETKKGNPIYYELKNTIVVRSLADVLYDKSKSEIRSHMKNWLSNKWVNESNLSDILDRLSTCEDTMEKVVMESDDEKNKVTFGYVVFFDLSIESIEEESGALAYALMQFTLPATVGQMSTDERDCLLAYLKFLMYKHFCDTNGPVLLGLKADCKEYSKYLPEEVKNYQMPRA